MGAVHAKIEHLLKEIPVTFSFRKHFNVIVLEALYVQGAEVQKRNNLDFLLLSMFNFCIDCAYLSVNGVNGIGEN